MDTTIRAAKAIRDAFDPEGVRVWQNNGVAAEQSVPHVHVHIAGTVRDGGTGAGDVERLPTSATDAIGDRLKPHLGVLR